MGSGEEGLAVEMRDIVKTFPGVVANDHVDFEARTGEIHALLGENGAGKTTLMNILYGLYRPDSGEIYVKGRKVEISSPKTAIKLGIGMVHQHFTLVPKLTIAENIVLGTNPTGFLLNLRKVEGEIKSFSNELGLKINPRAKIDQLSVGEQQIVEILKILYRGADILILDEPTSVLAPPEVKKLFKTLRLMVNKGKTVIFVTHKLQEALEISDRITVLRKGRNVGTVHSSEVTVEELSKMVVGYGFTYHPSRARARGRRVLEIRKLTVLNDRGLPAVKEISMEVHGGEIVGLAGVAGNGQKELAESIIGQRKPVSGRIFINGVEVTNKPPDEIRLLGLAYIPEDRMRDGIIPDLSVMENLVLNSFRNRFVKNLFFMDKGKMEKYSRELVEKFDIKATNLRDQVKFLSGGNIQRLILATELPWEIKVLVACQPTRGLDVKATEYVHMLLMELRNRGTGILLISEDLDEILELSDRLMVIYRGEIAGEFKRGQIDLEKLGLLMTGVRNK